MTRINVIPVSELSDNFLLAEHFELPRLFPLVHRASQRYDREIPETYRLGEGHMRFFYDKLYYLYRRMRQLREEGTRRKLDLRIDPNVDPIYHSPVTLVHLPRFYWKDYTPTEEAIQLNRDRLQYRRRYEGGTYATDS